MINFFKDKKNQMIAAVIVLALTGCMTLVFHHIQTGYDHELNQANEQLSYYSNKLVNVKADTESKLLNETSFDNENVKRVMLDREVKTKAKKLAKALFSYKNSKAYLTRQDKVKSILADSALSNKRLFPSEKEKSQVQGQDMSGELYSTTLKNGLSQGDEVPVYMQVHYGTYYNGHLTQSTSEGFELIYNKSSEKFTKINSIGKFAVKKNNGEE